MTQANKRDQEHAERREIYRADLHQDLLEWMRDRLDRDKDHIDPEEFLDVAIMVIHEAVDG